MSFLWVAEHLKVGIILHGVILIAKLLYQTTSSSLGQATLKLLANASIAACDDKDGVRDGLIENPITCNFDIGSLECAQTSSNATDCLTTEQIALAKAIYGGPIRARGKPIYPGFSFGSEVEWTLQPGLAQLFTIPILQNLVYDELTYDASTFNWESDVDDVDSKAGVLIDEISVDLCTYRNRGGKMLVTQGWADPLNSALWPIQQLEQLERFFGGDVSDFYRLFMIPGGGHCGAAPQYPSIPAVYHTVSQLVDWVEKGREPDFVLSTGPPDGSDRTRRLCPWPQTARYIKGDSNNWRSFNCR